MLSTIFRVDIVTEGKNFRVLCITEVFDNGSHMMSRDAYATNKEAAFLMCYATNVGSISLMFELM